MRLHVSLSLCGVACRYYQDVCMLEQPFVVDDSKRVQDVIKVRMAG